MSYPAIPLEGYWNNNISHTPKFTEIKLGEGGVNKRERSQLLNPVRKTWNVTANVKDRDTLENFLMGRNGLPFTYQGSAYTCTSWNWKWIVWVSGTGGVWELSSVFTEDLNPEIL